MTVLRSFFRTIFRLLVVLILCAMGLLGTGMAYISYKKVADLNTWQQIDATVISSLVKKENRQKGTAFCPYVTVKYEFQGQSQTSALDIEDGPCSLIQLSATTVIEKYGEGITVRAFVNPSKPSEIRVATFTLGTIFYLAVFVAILGLLSVIFIWRMSAKMPLPKSE